MVRVKICGVRSAAGLAAAADAGVDWVGLNFFPPSPRFVTAAEAAAISAARPGGPERIGLFVDPSDDEVAAVLAAVPLDGLQIYGPLERAAALRARFGVPVWLALGVSTRAELPERAPGVDGLLVEPKPPPGASRPGGNGVGLDWAMLAGWAAPRPWMLAGGLTPDTVAEAVRLSGAEAVDVASGVERVRGVKDAGLIRAFVEGARRGCAGRDGQSRA